MDVVETAPHEYTANLIYDEHGLDPYFAADAQIKAGNGKQEATFEAHNETWEATLYYQNSGIQPPTGGHTPNGTKWRLEQTREYRLQVTANDSVGKRRFNAHISPRWTGMKVQKRNGDITKLSIPDTLTEGINIRISGANIPFDAYPDLLQAAANAVDINPHYFNDPHPYSNIVDAAKYVRLHTDRSGPLHARDGPIAQLAHLLEHDRTGYRKLIQNDQDDHGNDLPGYYHTVTLAPYRVTAAFPDHTFPREIKHYYTREAHKFPKTNPLRHPKLEIAYQTSRWDEKLSPLNDIDELNRQLDQTIYSTLAEAGLQIHPGTNDPFIPDEYFTANPVDQPRDWIYDLELTQIKHDQESVVLKYLADGFSPVEWESLTTLVTDGGELSPRDLAVANDRHEGSVRRALRRMEHLLDREYGTVRLRSPFIADLIHKKLTIARENARDAIAATAKIAHTAERELDEHTSAFIAWAAAVGADIDNTRDARMTLRMNLLDTARELEHQIQQGYQLWTSAGRDPARYRQATIKFEDGSITRAWNWL